MRNYMYNLSVRSKLVLLISAVVFVLLTFVLAIVWLQSREEVKGLIEQDMQVRNDAFLSIEQYRIRDRAHIASLIGSKMSGVLQSADGEKRASSCSGYWTTQALTRMTAPTAIMPFCKQRTGRCSALRFAATRCAIPS